MSKRFFGADPYYKGLPEIVDADGKRLPKEITFPANGVSIYNDWFADELIGGYDPEDDWIDAIDKAHHDTEPAPKAAYHVGEHQLSDFDVYTESRKSLTIQERTIFDAIWFDGLSFRQAEKKLGVDHCKIHTQYKKILAKLGRGILKRHTIKDSD